MIDLDVRPFQTCASCKYGRHCHDYHGKNICDKCIGRYLEPQTEYEPAADLMDSLLPKYNEIKTATIYVRAQAVSSVADGHDISFLAACRLLRQTMGADRIRFTRRIKI